MSEGKAALEAEIRRLIAIAGPMPISEYMALCLGHPQHGYYTTRDPFGSAGDFITSPEVSQMFGELVGLWAASVWRMMGCPENVRLIELGPGRGTMMADALRAAHVVPEFRKAVAVHLVESSPALQRRQQQTLRAVDVSILWHDSLADVPGGPAVILANEFFDALPVNQAVKRDDGWHERVVEIGSGGDLAFGVGAEPMRFFEQTLPVRARSADLDAIFEWRSDHVVLEIGRRLVHEGGAALAIDYGHVESALGDTLQAVRGHAFAGPLMTPGLADLTAHVDFEALALSAETIGARVHGPVIQAEFLRRMGIETRAAALKKVAPPSKAAEIDTALARLTDTNARGMGFMFKAIGLSHPQLATLPALEKGS
jgi:NADH dehydrogenase [ubiquinone] 1 alpha subcomplex assembly factor 7